MNYRFLFLMDNYASLNLETETSLALMSELLERGHEVFWVEEPGLCLKSNQVYGQVCQVTQVHPLKTRNTVGKFLSGFDALLVRKDPPFDQRYLHLTLLLGHLPDSLMQFNSVSALRNFNEKLLPLRWPELTPPTLVTECSEQILAFLQEHKNIIIKPLDDCSGRGIERLKLEDSVALSKHKISHYLDRLSTVSPFVMVQRFIPEIRLGDKRVYLVNGKALGWVNRVPKTGQFLANIHQGARCEATQLSVFEKQVITIIAPFLVEQGIFFAGLDFIGEYLTEINITSPSAVRQINQVMGQRLEVHLVTAMLQALERSQTFMLQ